MTWREPDTSKPRVKHPGIIHAGAYLVALAASAPPCLAAPYFVQDLGALTAQPTRAWGLSASGQVVGSIGVNGNYRAFRTEPGQIITAGSDLGSLGGAETVAYGVNSAGQAAGYSTTSDGRIRAVRTVPNGQVTPGSDLGDLGGAIHYSYGTGINDAGQVVGGSNASDDHVRAFRTAPGGSITPSTDLGPVGGHSFAYAINASGQVTGNYLLPSAMFHAFRTTATGSINPASDLGSLGFDSRGYGINASGQVVGATGVPNEPIANSHAFRTTATGSIDAASDLGTLGGSYASAWGIDTAGRAVGYSYLAGDQVQHAWMAEPDGPMQDLNDLIAPGTGWVLQQARAINDAGQIVGWGTLDGQTHAFLLNVPEPAASLAVIAALAALPIRQRRQTVVRP